MYTYDKIVLPNGLRVIFLELPHVHSAVCAAYVGMGSRYEPPNRAGLSHLVEHMLFRGARGYDGSVDFLEAVEDIGGSTDAFTSPEYAAFIMRSHARHAVTSLRLLGDLLLGGDFRSDDLELERAIVLEEIMEFKDSSGDYVSIDDIAYNLMWKKDGNGSLSFGNEQAIRDFATDDLGEHYKTLFVPSNAVICLAGNFQRQTMEEAIVETFGGLSGARPQLDAQIVDEQKAAQSTFVSIPAPSVQVKLCHKAFSYRHPDLLKMLLIADVLGGGVSSRLMSGVREREGLVYEIACFPTLFGDVGSVDVFTRTSARNLVRTIQAVLGEFNRLVDEGITERELRRTEESVFTQMHLVMDSPMDMANWFGVEELLVEPESPETPEDQAEKVRQVSQADVADVLQTVFSPDRRNLVVLGPCRWLARRKLRKLLDM